jgi:hypothetical protein
MLFALILTTVFTGGLPGAYRFRWLVLLAAVAYMVGGDERLQRFTTLQDPEFLADRLSGSVNMSFMDLVRRYPLGNGLGGGGTSVPYFLQHRIRNVVVMENEYARILLETGLPGLVMWSLFLVWAFTRRYVRRLDLFHLGRKLALVACACAFGTGFIGLGLFTSVPMTALVLLLTGWVIVPEVPFAPALEPVPDAPPVTPQMRYGRAH